MIYTHTAVAIAALAVGLVGGWKANAWRHDAIDLAAVKVERRDQLKRVERAAEAAAAHEEFKAKKDVEYVTRTKTVARIVERPVYLESCLDPDGLQLLNAEIAGRALPGEPSATLPAAAGAARR